MKVKQILSPLEYERFIDIGYGIEYTKIAELHNISYSSFMSSLFLIRKKLENNGIIQKRHYSEKKNYNYLIDFAKSYVKQKKDKKRGKNNAC